MVKNPNPLCLSCGKPTKTLDFEITGAYGGLVGMFWKTSCHNLGCKDGCKFEGRGKTAKEARADYGRKFDDDFNEIKR